MLRNKTDVHDDDDDSKVGGALFHPGLRLRRHRATTAHACALYPFHADGGLGPRGIYIGEDVSAGGASWHYDPFQLYTDGVITSPNILVLGMVGAGKSSAVKTLLYGWLGCSGPTANRGGARSSTRRGNTDLLRKASV